ncbi:MAG: hypothetical protein WAV46_04055 [Candidatus Moraniibacteriota bacterium]
MTAKFQDLYAFIDRAEKSRKYQPGTARAYTVALRLFEKELREEERESVSLFKANLPHIYATVCSKNSTFTSGSLATYKSRVAKVLADFEKYGVDLTKMASWTPSKPIIRKKRSVMEQREAAVSKGPDSSGSLPKISAPDIHRIELALRADAKFLIEVPRDITESEIAIVTGILNSLKVAPDKK